MKSLLLYLFTIITLLACEKTADISSSAEYAKNNVNFSYPKNWKVTEDALNENVRYLFIESPGDAIFIIQLYLKDEAVTLKEFTEWFSAEVANETPIISFNDNEFTNIVKFTKFGKAKGIKENISLSLLGQDIPHSRVYISLENNDKVAFLISQVATEDSTKVEPGFDLILKTFTFE